VEGEGWIHRKKKLGRGDPYPGFGDPGKDSFGTRGPSQASAFYERPTRYREDGPFIGAQ